MARAHRCRVLSIALLVSSAAGLDGCAPGPADEPARAAGEAPPANGPAPEPVVAPSPPPQPPAHFPALPAQPDNPTTGAGFVLGRRLFFDVRLSRTQTVSCASCHDPRRAFTIDEALPTRGVTGKALVRHPPSLVNLAWAGTGLFWDGGSKNLESLALAPLTHVDEMGREGDLESMMGVIATDALYPSLFRAAFASASPTIGEVMKALAQFQRAIFSATSRWDDIELGRGRLSAEEEVGRSVFDRACARCHAPGLFTDAGYHNNGLDSAFGDEPEGPKRGRGRITFASADIGKYRTPTLRNVALSGPYMHDGRFGSLDAVIAHYRDGMVESPSLDPGFRRPGTTPGVTMSDQEARALLAFLELLTDRALAVDPSYLNPFDAP